MHLPTLLSISLLTLVNAVPLVKERDSISTVNTKQCPDFCAGTAYNKTLTHTYVCGDSRLGPKRTPSRLILGNELETYDRFGGLCPGKYLATWYNSTANSFIYPPLDGFQLDTEGEKIEGNVTLRVGSLLDRFGSEYGSFVSPYGAPYMQRALPPSNLDTPVDDPMWPYNYHVYKVEKEFVVLSGPIAAWFGQPGQGVQYKLSTNVMGLIGGGFLSRVALN